MPRPRSTLGLSCPRSVLEPCVVAREGGDSVVHDREARGARKDSARKDALEGECRCLLLFTHAVLNAALSPLTYTVLSADLSSLPHAGLSATLSSLPQRSTECHSLLHSRTVLGIPQV